MKRNKSIEIEYINEKLEKSPIITMIDDAIMFDSSKEIEKIKESVIGILECTNIEEKITENSEGRHIYKLNDKVSKHIISTISKDVDIKEKKQIIKDIIKEILNNKSVIIIHGGSIFINDSGVAKEKIIINKK